MHKRMNNRLSRCLFLTFLLLSGFAGSIQAAHEEGDLLRPEEAFVPATPRLTDGNIQLDWKISDGYYLYQSKFRVQPVTADVSLGEVEFSPAETKQDPIFGPVQVYHHRASLKVPLEQVPAGTSAIELKLRYQGCADKGICFPPQTRTVTVAYQDTAAPRAPTPVALATPAPAPSQPNALDELSALGDNLGLDMEDDIIPPEKAYQVSANSPDGNTLLVRWKIAEGTYLYQDKVKVRIDGEGVQAGTFDLPPADIKKDSIKPDGSIGDVAVYHQQLELRIPLLRKQKDATEIELKLGYQGCAERGICYPPQKKTLRVALPAATGSDTTATAPAPARPVAVSDSAEPLNEQDRLLTELHDSSLWLALLISLGFGILVAFTACMYPMIPILTSLIMGHGEKVTPLRAFELSLAYTQGIALTYGVIGIAMAVVGKSLGIQSALQTPWFLVPSILLFVALALSMFGFYQIQMPSALQSRLHAMSNQQKGGSVIGVGLMGVVSALIVGPCGGPVLLAMLAFAAQSDNMLHGFLAMWLFGTGMGLPLLVMGAGGGALLPKAGTWMDTVKATGGVIMLALALSFMERMSPTYIPTSVIMLAWGVLLISVAVYMGALRQLPEQISGWYRLWKGLGVALLIYGATFLLGVAAGGGDTLQPLRGIAVGGGAGGAAAAQQAHLEFRPVKTIADLEREVAAARTAGKPVMLDFYADWCTYCKTMEKEIFPNPKVQNALQDFVLLQADITRMDESDTALTSHLDLPAPPALYFWDRQGQLHKNLRLVGEPTIQQLVDRATKVSQ